MSTNCYATIFYFSIFFFFLSKINGGESRRKQGACWTGPFLLPPPLPSPLWPPSFTSSFLALEAASLAWLRCSKRRRSANKNRGVTRDVETGGIFNGDGRKSEKGQPTNSFFLLRPGYLNIERASRGNKVDDESTRWPVASGCIKRWPEKFQSGTEAEAGGIAATRCSAGISNGVVIRMLLVVVARSPPGITKECSKRCVNRSSNSSRMHFSCLSNINFPRGLFLIGICIARLRYRFAYLLMARSVRNTYLFRYNNWIRLATRDSVV